MHLKLMTTVTQDNDAHDDSENGGVEYNTCVWCGLARGGAAGDGAAGGEAAGGGAVGGGAAGGGAAGSGVAGGGAAGCCCRCCWHALLSCVHV